MMRTVFLACDADPRLAESLRDEGYSVSYVTTSGLVGAAVSNHPDMFMCRLGTDDEAELVIYPGLYADLPDSQVREYPGMRTLEPDYPHDIAYNAACTGRFFIHNLRYTAPELRARAEELGMVMVDVKQGYSKCSTVTVDEDSIITYDRGITEACRKAGIDVLTVEPGHILLPGFNTGFIGGASGRIGDTVYFNGDLSAHPDFRAITSFIENRGLDVRWFSDWPLTDIGSIIIR